MPMHEDLTLRAQLVVEVDGHTLRFEHVVSTAGARYHGALPRGPYTTCVLEAGVREALELATDATTVAAVEAVGRLYPAAAGTTASTKDGR